MPVVMRKILTAGLAGVLLSAAPVAQASAPSEDARAAWSAGQDVVGRILSERAATRFGPLDQVPAERRQRIERLLDQAGEVLATSPALSGRDALRRLAEEERVLRRRIAEDRVAQAGAPPPPSGLLEQMRARLSPTWTQADYAARIARSEERIRRIGEERVAVRDAFVADLERIGVRLRADQVDGMLSLASADDLVAIQAMFSNLRGIVASLREQAQASGESLEVARRLYGVHAVLLEVAMDAHRDLLRKIDQDWGTRLAEIERGTRELREEAQRILRAERDRGLQEVTRANVAAQDLTLRAVALYRQRLAEQRSGVEASLRRLEAQARVAINTWATAERAADLAALMRFSDRAFEALSAFEVPEIRPFESRELQSEVERLTERLRGFPGS
jgi:hypothetical protein